MISYKWFDKFIVSLVLLSLSGTHNMNHYVVDNDNLLLGHNAEFTIPVYMNHKQSDNNVTSAFIKAEWDSLDFEFVDVVHSSHWDSLGFITVENRDDVSNGLYQVAYASVDSLDCDTLMFSISLKTRNRNNSDSIKFVGQFNESSIRIEQNSVYVIDESLPVEMISYNAVGNYSGADISWTTGYEQGSSHFEIYYIPVTWNYVSGLWIEEDPVLAGRVESIGDSSRGNTYSEFIALEPGTYRFKILQYDVSGSSTAYNGNIFTVLGEDMTLESWPNPAQDNITIRMYSPYQTHVSLVLYNTIGAKVGILYEGGILGNYEFSQSISGIPNGIYFLVAELTNKNVVHKIVIHRQ